MQYSHAIVETSTPAPVTLAAMGRTAIAAADTPAIREWAARLATRAQPRDYRGMLEQLYGGILRRWRYVPESEEWIHGTPDSLLAHVMGTKYTAPDERPSTVDLDAQRGEYGWGDCDDVSTVVAAGVRALGMAPYWRVARGPDGAHVSVLARTPDGELVSIDPVGHPRHPFGWALETDDIQLFALDGQPSDGFSGAPMANGTYYSEPNGRPVATAHRGHWCATHAGDARGPRSLALPEREARLFQRGIVIDGCPAIDDNGNSYTYDANRDMWLDARLAQTRLANLDEPMGGVGRRARRKQRRTGRRARRRRVVQRVAKRIRGAASRVLQSRVAQALVSRGLQAVTGTPAALTRGAMQAGGKLFERGGVVGLAKRLRRNPRGAAHVVAQAGRVGALRGRVAFSGDCGCGAQYMVSQDGSRPFFAAPVLSLSGVPGMHSFGQLDVVTTPQPGRWYRIQRGDTLLTIAERALGQPRLTHSKWINAAAANRVFHRPTKAGFETTQYGKDGGIVSLNPDYSADPDAASHGEPGSSYAVIWIPAAPGDEPPDEVPEVVVEPDVEDVEPEVEPEVDVVPDTPDLPPVEPEVEPDVPDVVVPQIDLAQQCRDRGGVMVPGQGCVVCPPGSTWSDEWFECLADVVTPDVVQPPDSVVPDVVVEPDVVVPDVVVEPDIPDMVVPDVVVEPDIPEAVDPTTPVTPWDPGATPGTLQGSWLGKLIIGTLLFG